jgi:hypothetical protein
MVSPFQTRLFTCILTFKFNDKLHTMQSTTFLDIREMNLPPEKSLFELTMLTIRATT